MLGQHPAVFALPGQTRFQAASEVSASLIGSLTREVTTSNEPSANIAEERQHRRSFVEGVEGVGFVVRGVDSRKPIVGRRTALFHWPLVLHPGLLSEPGWAARRRPVRVRLDVLTHWLVLYRGGGYTAVTATGLRRIRKRVRVLGNAGPTR